MGRWILCVLCTVASGCVVAPNHGDHIGSRSAEVDFQVFATKAHATLSITCSHHYGDAATVATFTGSASPLALGGEAVYPKRHAMVLPNGCWEPWPGSGYAFITYVRVLQDNYNAAVFDADGSNCLFAEIADGVGPVTAGIDCRRDGADILLYASY